MKKVIAGMDLHSNNVVIGVMDMDGKRVGEKKRPCELKAVVKFLAPFKKRLEQVAVESTYNWYWLWTGCERWTIRWCWPILRRCSNTAASKVRVTPTLLMPLYCCI